MSLFTSPFRSTRRAPAESSARAAARSSAGAAIESLEVRRLPASTLVYRGDGDLMTESGEEAIPGVFITDSQGVGANLANGVVSFTINGLPQDRYGLKVVAKLQVMQFTGADDFDSVTLTAAGATDTSDYYDEGSGNGYLAEAVVLPDHTGTSTVITFSGTGEHEWEAGDYLWATEFEVYALSHDVSVESKTIALGQTTDVVVTATKADGSPAANVTLTAEDYDGAIISPTTSVTTDADGKATVQVEGLGKGTSTLAYGGPTVRPTTGPGSAPPATQRVVKPKFIFASQYEIDFTTATSAKISITLVNEDDEDEVLTGVKCNLIDPEENDYYEVDWQMMDTGGEIYPGNESDVHGKIYITIKSKGITSGEGPPFKVRAGDVESGPIKVIVRPPPP